MSKQVITLAPDLRPDRPRRRFLSILLLAVVVSLLLPIFVDAIALCYGRWREMLGTPIAVRTPTLDAIGERVAAVREDAWSQVSSRFQRVPWNPYVVIPVSVAVMLVAMVMLRL